MARLAYISIVVAKIVRGQMEKKFRGLDQAAYYGVRSARRSGALCRDSRNGNDEPSRGKYCPLPFVAGRIPVGLQPRQYSLRESTLDALTSMVGDVKLPLEA
jgi:hypothetical protein